MEYRELDENKEGPVNTDIRVSYHRPAQKRHCRRSVITTFRCLVAVLSLAVLMLVVTGQLLPFCRQANKKEEIKYSVWKELKFKVKRMRSDWEMREDNDVQKICAVLSLAFSLTACVLCFVFVGLWARHEHQRRHEAEAFTNAQAFAEEEMASKERSDAYNRNPEQRIQISSMTYPSSFEDQMRLHERERQRRRVDRRVGIAAFSFLLATIIPAIVTLFLMVGFYVSEVKDDVDETKGESSGYMAGMPLFLAAVLANIVAFIVLALPCATRLHLCCPPSMEAPTGNPVTWRAAKGDDDEEWKQQRRTAGNDAPQLPQQQQQQQQQQASGLRYDTGTSAMPPDNAHFSQEPQPGRAFGLHRQRVGSPTSNNNNYTGSPQQREALSSPSRNPVAYPTYEERRDSVPLFQEPQKPALFSSPPPALPQVLEPGDTGAAGDSDLRKPPSHSSPYLSQNSVSNTMPPPLYVPTVVGTYPEALPGPANMDNITLHHVAEDGTMSGPVLPATEAAWRRDTLPAAASQPAVSAPQDADKGNGAYASGGYISPAKKL